MTRTLFVMAGLLLAGLIALFVVGLTAAVPGLLIVSFLCAIPLFMFTIGAAIGRASTEFVIAKQAPVQVMPTRAPARASSRAHDLLS